MFLIASKTNWARLVYPNLLAFTIKSISLANDSGIATFVYFALILYTYSNIYKFLFMYRYSTVILGVKMGKRTTEFVLGLIGGIFGFFGAIIALFVGGLGGAFGASGASTIVGLGWGAMLLSIVGIVGSVVVKHKSKLGGWLMIISAVGGLICISFFYILSFVLLLIAGLMGAIKKDK